MKRLFFVLMMVASYVDAYDNYNILIDSSLNKDEIEYFKENCKFNFNYTCIAIKEKIEKEKNGK